MIPLLPCASIDDQLRFYEALGFEVTYRQKAPNAYAAVQRGPIELHFFTMKGYDPATSYSTCYAFVSDVDTLYAAFREGLIRVLGRVPSRGIPRLGALRDMSYGVRQFVMTDPGGNAIRFGQATAVGRERPGTGSGSRLELALDAATQLMDSKGDPETAARVIDGALAATPDPPMAHLVQAWILRADAAHALGDDRLCALLLGKADAAAMTEGERADLADDLARAAELRAALTIGQQAR